MIKATLQILSLLLLQSTLLFGQSSYFTEGKFFLEVDKVMSKHVKNGVFDYAALHTDLNTFLDIMAKVDQADLSTWDNDTKKAFYLNAYNLTVIKAILLAYPIESTQTIPGFFDKQEHLIANQMMTLNYLENEIIRKQHTDARIHFALNCGAKGCPEIVNEAYFPERLNEQLDQRAMAKLNDPTFVQFDNDNRKLLLNQIFEWYGEDFGKNNKEVIAFINQYRTEKIPNDYKIAYYPYDWSINSKAGATNTETPKQESFRYLVSSLYDKGEFEINLFNNYFSKQSNLDQVGSEWRTGFFSNLVQVLIGISPRFNAGFDIQLRSVSRQPQNIASFFEATKYRNDHNIINIAGENLGYTRTGFSRFGPKVKYLPLKKVSNLSVQHTLYFPFPNERNLQGGDGTGFLDWDGMIFWNQIFYDTALSPKLNLFAEADLLFENIGDAMFKNESGYYQVSTPLTVILSYFPTNEIIIYGLTGYAPQWGTSVNVPDGDEPTTTDTSYVPYNQFGIGAKYLFNQRYQLEILVNDFNETDDNSKAATYNIGFRYIFKK